MNLPSSRVSPQDRGLSGPPLRPGVSRKFQSLLWTQAGATGVGNFISRSSLNQCMSDPEAPPGLGQVGEKTACPSVLLGAGPAPAAAPEGEGGRASLC